MKCMECDKKAKWVRCTQFAGDHFFCKEHAKLEDDFKQKDPSYFYWHKVKKYGKKIK